MLFYMCNSINKQQKNKSTRSGTHQNEKNWLIIIVCVLQKILHIIISERSIEREIVTVLIAERLL